MSPRTTILWFRRDLRLHDHPALDAALQSADRVIPLFVLDDALIRGRWPSPNRVWFMLESLRRLDEGLRALGSGLVVRHGRPADVIPRFARETSAADVFVSRDYSPYARRRDRAVADRLAAIDVAFHARPGTLVHEPEEVRSKSGDPFSVFSPFRRAWEILPRRELLPAPPSLPPPGSIETGIIPSLAELGIEQPIATEIIAPGESAARERLNAWASPTSELSAYKEQRDRLDLDGTSRLSQDLRWGLLSPLEVVARCEGPSLSQQSYVSEVVWREFYYHVLYHNPRVTTEPFQKQFAGISWVGDDEALAAWREGRTGYPVVDAAMRQLATTGWMHNRARMIVASFLTKHLLINFRRGEEFFMQHLVDGDVASNDGGWQWASSTGTDPQPYFRIFNPILQGKRFDPSGDFVRRWIPELKQVDTAYIHEPWTMTPDIQKAARCRIGVDYPAPIVEHAEARGRALAVFEAARGAAR